MNEAEPPICYNCKNRTPKKAGPFFCSAFPAGIPEKILDNIWDHRGPVPGDNGIRFEPIDDKVPPPGIGGPEDPKVAI